MEWTNELALSGKDVAASHRAQGSIFFVGNATVILSWIYDPNRSELLAPRRPRPPRVRHDSGPPNRPGARAGARYG